VKIAIAGAGAMGSRFGSMLSGAGADVVLLDGWREHIDAIAEDGLRIVDESGERTAWLTAARFEEWRQPVDAVLVFGKAMQTEKIMQSCRGFITPDTWVITLQNGLGNLEVIERFVDRDRIIVGTTTFSAELLGPGRIRAFGAGSTELMTVEPDPTGASRELVSLMNAAGLDVTVTADVMQTVWTKVAFNSALNALCTVLGVPVGALVGYSALSEVVESIVDEVIAVAASQGIGLDRQRILGTIDRQYAPDVAGDHLPSMLVDFLHERPTEIAYLNGAVVAFANRSGVPVPNNRLIAHLVRMLEVTRQARVTDMGTIHLGASRRGRDDGLPNAVC
jgi:2-dehydropantoate 2-reductase